MTFRCSDSSPSKREGYFWRIGSLGNKGERGQTTEINQLYSLWTIPSEDNWSVLFNKKIPDWGTTYDSKGNTVVLRDASEDILEVQVPTVVLPRSENSFTIAFENEDQLYLTLYWDTTKVKIP